MSKKQRNSAFDRGFNLITYIILGILLLLVAYPLYFTVIASISDPKLVASGKVLLYPRSLSLEGYKKVIEYKPLWTGYINTIVYTICYTAISTMVTLMAGFGLSRKNLVGHNIIMGFMVFTMFFSGGLIPTYLLMRDIGLYSKPIIIILMGSVSVYNIIIARTFFKSNIPDELFEAANMDGCNQSRFFLSIVLPLSPSLIAVLVLFAAVTQWNSWFSAMIYLTKETQMPLQMVLRDLIVSQSAVLVMNQADSMGGDMAAQVYLLEAMRYAIIIVASLPILCVYPFLQKYFIKGIMVGSIKG